MKFFEIGRCAQIATIDTGKIYSVSGSLRRVQQLRELFRNTEQTPKDTLGILDASENLRC